MTFPHFNRRLHLYLGMFLLPWFFMYGISSLPFTHGAWLDKLLRDNRPDKTVRFDRPYSIDVPAAGDLRPTGERILRDAGMSGAFGIFRKGEGKIGIYRYDFRSATDLTYSITGKRLRAEDVKFRWDAFLGGFHARGGFKEPSFLMRAWAVLIDIVCIGILIWIASGIYMWWFIRGHKLWGAIALAGGLASFALFLLRL
jgi:hypothetical protein